MFKNFVFVFVLGMTFLSWGSLVMALTPQEALLASLDAEKRGSIDEAIQKFLLGKEGTDPLLLNKRLAWLFLLKKDYGKSYALYDEAVRLKGDDYDALTGRILVLKSSSQWKKAEISARDALGVFRDNYYLNRHLGEILLEGKNYGDLIRLCLKYPSDPFFLSLSGWAYFKLNNFDLADFKFSNALKFEPGNISALSGKGGTNKIKIEEYRREIKEDPKNHTVIRKLVDLLIPAGLLLEAYPLQVKAAEFFKDRPGEQKKLGWLAFQLGKFQESIDGYKRALEFGDDTDSLIGILKSLYAIKDFPSLEKISGLILKKEPENYYAWYYQGLYHLNQKDWVRSEKIFQKFPLDPFSLTHLGEIKEKQGAMAEARGYYLKALGVLPGMVLALQGIGRLNMALIPGYLSEFAKNPKKIEKIQNAIAILEANGKTREIADLTLKALEATPDNEYVLMTGAYSHYLLGDYERSLTLYRHAYKVNSKNHIALRGEVNTLLAMKKFREVRKPLEELFAHYPKSDELRKLLSFALYSGGFLKAQIELAQSYPNDMDLKRTRGWALFSQGKLTHSEDVFKEIQEAHPEDKGAEMALDTLKGLGQITTGIFYTDIEYGGFQEMKGVSTVVAGYTPHRWLSFRAAYNRTETKLTPTFKEDAFGVGMTYKFAKDWDLSGDLILHNNNDATSDGLKSGAFQLGYQVHRKLKTTLELDLSDYPGDLYVVQFAPRLDWFPHNKFWLQSKAYFGDVGGKDQVIFFTNFGNPDGKYEAFQQMATYFFDAKWSLGGTVWGGTKRFVVEADRMFLVNNYDKDEGGWAVKTNYRHKTLFDISLGYTVKNMESFYTKGREYYQKQWTAGINFRY